MFYTSTSVSGSLTVVLNFIQHEFVNVKRTHWTECYAYLPPKDPKWTCKFNLKFNDRLNWNIKYFKMHQILKNEVITIEFMYMYNRYIIIHINSVPDKLSTWWIRHPVNSAIRKFGTSFNNSASSKLVAYLSTLNNDMRNKNILDFYLYN